MASVEEKVKGIIVEQLGVDGGEVTATASFMDDLGADSSQPQHHRQCGGAGLYQYADDGKSSLGCA